MKSFSRLIIFGLAIVAGSAAVSAFTVSVEPGGLRDAILQESTLEEVTTLNVTGSLNAADFDVFSDLTNLKSLDLSQATIAAYSGEKTATGLSSSPANVLPDCAFMSSSCTDLSLPSGITEIGSAAFGNAKLSSLTIPSTVTKIATGAFANMENLKSIKIPASVTSMGEMIFKDCSSLESAVINAKVATLPASTFCNCSALTSVTLPESLTTIGESAFVGCVNLPTVSIPESLTTIGDMAFANSGLTSINLSDAKVSSIGAWAFACCYNLKSISTNLSVSEYGAGAFFNNTKLDITLGDLASDTTELPDYLLYGASEVSTSQFNKTKVSKIGKYALSGITASQISLPESLSYLDDNAMERWSNVKEINAADLKSVPELGNSVWEEVDQENTILLVDSTTIKYFLDAPQWKEFTIESATASSVSITNVGKDANLRACFDGSLLLIEAGIDISAAQLYDISGRCINYTQTAGTNRLTIDTAPFDTRVFILRLLLADGTTPVLKLFR